MLPKNNKYEGYDSNDDIEVLIDYKNNVHFVIQEKQKIDVYRNELLWNVFYYLLYFIMFKFLKKSLVIKLYIYNEYII